MALTFQELINSGVLDALAAVYREPTDAQLLLTSISFPIHLLPNFDRQSDPLAFWARVCQLIQNGAFAGGFEALAEAAAARYPANPAFARFAKGQPRQVTVSQTNPADYLLSRLFIEGPDLSRWEVNDLQASLRLEAVVADFAQMHPELGGGTLAAPPMVSVSRIRTDGSTEKLDLTKTFHSLQIQDGDTLSITYVVDSTPRTKGAQTVRPTANVTPSLHFQRKAVWRSDLKDQVESVLDESTGKIVDVIVQVATAQPGREKLREVAGEMLQRRRQSQMPRDLLASLNAPNAPGQADPGQSTAQRRQARLKVLSTLLDSSIVKAALQRTALQASQTSMKRAPTQFWTSLTTPLQLTRDELWKLGGEVANLAAVHRNRTLQVPYVTQSEPLKIEGENLLPSTWGVDQIKALAAWGAFGARGQGVTIGLLDTGIDATHPDLAGKIAAWAEFDAQGQPAPNSQPHDSDQHGTHCAGVLVGLNHSGYFIGIAPEAKIAAGLVLNGENGGSDAQILAGIDWAVQTGVDVLSMSLGGLTFDEQTPATYTEAILTCSEAGIPVVVAIGNEGAQTTSSPGNDLFALSVGATDYRDRVAGFSGGRTQIIQESPFINPKYLPLPYAKPDLSAPGVAIYSAIPGGGWAALNGTSMATPYVAGAIALLLSATTIREQKAGFEKVQTIQDLILGAVEDLGEAGQDHRYGFGRLDVLRAITSAKQRGY